MKADARPRLPRAAEAQAPMTRPSPATMRACLAVGLATRMRVGRWAPLSDVLELLPVVDQANDDAVIAAAVESRLVTVNPGWIPYSIARSRRRG